MGVRVSVQGKGDRAGGGVSVGMGVGVRCRVCEGCGTVTGSLSACVSVLRLHMAVCDRMSQRLWEFL